MVNINQQNAVHRNKMQRLLISIADNPFLSSRIYFKGGTCAAMLGYLDRFSVDLDFDPHKKLEQSDVLNIRKELLPIFKSLDFKIDNDENHESLFFTLKYKAMINQRNTLMISIFDEVVKSNEYQKTKILEIDRFVICQTVESMFANKLVSVIDRYNRHKRIAGRDIYDVNHFFEQGYEFREEIIEERTGQTTKEYIEKLVAFIEKEVTEELITRDLNMLLPFEKFNKVRKTLKQDTLLFLNSVIK